MCAGGHVSTGGRCLGRYCSYKVVAEKNRSAQAREARTDPTNACVPIYLQSTYPHTCKEAWVGDCSNGSGLEVTMARDSPLHFLPCQIYLSQLLSSHLVGRQLPMTLAAEARLHSPRVRHRVATRAGILEILRKMRRRARDRIGRPGG
jgi:hypothetical protein